MKSILINSYYFYPENTPRSFRTTELTKALINKGYDVTLAIPSRYKKQEEKIKEKFNITNIIFCGKEKNNTFNKINNNTDKKKLNTKIKKLLKRNIFKIVKYFISDKNIFYFIDNYKSLRNLEKEFDCVLSIGLPFSVHLGTYFYLKNKNIKWIADYGDPFSENPANKIARYFHYIEKKILKRASYITIPTMLSRKYYEHIIEYIDKVIIIPQGFEMKSLSLYEYKENEKVKFAYAGVFYEKIRNPKELFEKLSLLECDFEFHIYTDMKNSETTRCLANIPKNIENKVIIHGLLPREECIYELSKYDFLINIENKNSGQIASKIIDYTLSKRPILNLKHNFEMKLLKDFISKDYRERLLIDINEFDIDVVSNKFEKLIK